MSREDGIEVLVATWKNFDFQFNLAVFRQGPKAEKWGKVHDNFAGLYFIKTGRILK